MHYDGDGDGSHFTSEPEEWEIYPPGEDDRIEFPFTRPHFLDSAELDAWLNCGRGADLHFEDWVYHGGEA
jgi:hypothetical protein